MFKAVLIEKDDRGYRANVTELPEDGLPEGDVAVDVEYSTLNYKDGLAITGSVLSSGHSRLYLAARSSM